MTPQAEAMLRTLLQHHQMVCRNASKYISVDKCTITYGLLCERIGKKDLAAYVGAFLQEIAEWCRDNGHPPINALVVNKDTRMPGGYDGAPDCSLLGWPKEVRACIEYKGYPATL